jgi:hypothetical protein
MKRWVRRSACVSVFASLWITGCANMNPAQEIGVVTAIGAGAPTNEVRQIYYLGVFDPKEQVPPTIYRIRVTGQSSLLSQVRFASGWVPAAIADGLSSSLTFDDSGNITVDSSDGASATLAGGRTLMAFGPEGFRKSPKDHRLVVVMSGNPEKYFNAVDSALASVARNRDVQRGDVLSRQLLEALATIDREETQLEQILQDREQ